MKNHQEPIVITNSRPLTHGDVLALAAGEVETEGQRAPNVQELRHSHHNIAMLVAQGRKHAEISSITGYSVGRIGSLMGAPAFQELVSHYSETKQEIFKDVMERLRVLGLSSIDELQAQLDENPKAWSKRELMELAELGLLKGRAGVGGPTGQQAAPFALTVQFVDPESRRPTGPLIDLKPEGE